MRWRRAWYRASEYLATVLPNRFVTDAEAIREYYKQRYGRDSLFIPYGADTGRVRDAEARWTRSVSNPGSTSSM